MKKALITGLTGQDGSYLAELLLSKEYQVFGLVRRNSTNTLSRVEHLLGNNNLKILEGEISDSGSVYSIIQEGQFDEVYNLAAQSHVGTSFSQPSYTLQVNAVGPANILEAIRKYSPSTKFYQASTSELFGKNFTTTEDGQHQDENTAFMPQSPYAVSKLDAHHTVRIYREGYNMHASCGILFNHESERRGENFVTRKITMWLAEFYAWHKGLPSEKYSPSFDYLEFAGDFISKKPLDGGVDEKFPRLRLGNIDAYRDWGHAQDYVEAMYLMMQRENPDDYVISTGETYSVRDFLSEAFNEIGIEDFTPYIVIDPKFYRPSEVEYLKGCSDKAEKVLGWKRQVTFKDLVKRMVWSDIDAAQKKKEDTTLKETV